MGISFTQNKLIYDSVYSNTIVLEYTD